MRSLMVTTLTSYFVIGMLLMVMGGPNADGLDTQLSNQFVNSTTGQFTDNIEGLVPDVNEETGQASGILAFIDSLKAVRGFLNFVSGIALAIPMVFLDLNIPYDVQVLFGMPMTLLLFLGIMYFARSGN